MTQYAKFEGKQAYLNSDFGRDYAMKVFELTAEELEKLVGRYKRGTRKGQLKGVLRWAVITEGGWVRDLGGGFVVHPGLRYGHAIVDSWTGEVFAGPDDRTTSNADRIRMTQMGGWKSPERAARERIEREAAAQRAGADRLEVYDALRAAGVAPSDAATIAMEEVA